MTSRIEQPTCLVTGARGYLGSRVKTGLQSRGWKVVELTREPRADVPAVRFQLGEDVSAQLLGGADALVHCAYDFKQLSWSRIQAINVAGSAKLFRAAREAKVRTLVEISSISAFEGCRSLYGKAKLETEKIAQDLGVISIRPALIWGDEPAGMFGRLVAQVESARVLPLFGGGRQIQYLTHEQDLCELIYSCVATKISPGPGPITFADEQPWTFRGILEEIARAKAKKISDNQPQAVRVGNESEPSGFPLQNGRDQESQPQHENEHARHDAAFEREQAQHFPQLLVIGQQAAGHAIKLGEHTEKEDLKANNHHHSCQ